MNLRHLATATATCFVLLNPTVWAADPADHEAHHPKAAASSTKTSKPAKAAKGTQELANKAVAKESMEKMDSQMKAMQDMHDKMMSAKTPEERQALMAEHMKLMKEGMAMMKDMGMAKENKEGMSGDMDMATYQQMMDKCMAMMATMMQMMMDRLPAVPAK